MGVAEQRVCGHLNDAGRVSSGKRRSPSLK